MGPGNCSVVTELILMGQTEDATIRAILFVVFLLIYSITLMGNVSIIILIRGSPQLHTPMYLFLSHLAFVDIGYSSSVTPVMLRGFLTKETFILAAGCVAQLCSVVTFGSAECFLLAAMAYDRYVAICSPLLYSTQMSSTVCTLLVGASYVGGCVNAWTFTGCLLNLSFCGPNKVNHFFCDYSPLLKLSCSHDFSSEVIPAISSGSIIVVTVFIIALSYVYILVSILKMRSPEGRQKAFSTCTSHLTAVTLFYGTITFIYVMPKSSYSTDQNKVVSVFYTVLSCSHDFSSEVIPAISSGSIIVVTVFIIALSYVYILVSILKMRSPEGRQKAFSTCTSHLTAVTLFYGTITFIYVMPKSSYSTDQNKVVSVFYTVVIPMLNPSSTASETRMLKRP
ncbi:Olfactory receptor 508 [Microtus ochrogaster]|uniref:Olfactory receptor n=1 Tax=Microtus ochrogaster TaxID=79684 RepID=A0A8J6H021_MICOH|nr:Olfactory receptor 508 [Microtus ochrogaster]